MELEAAFEVGTGGRVTATSRDEDIDPGDIAAAIENLRTDSGNSFPRLVQAPQ